MQGLQWPICREKYSDVQAQTQWPQTRDKKQDRGAWTPLWGRGLRLQKCQFSNNWPSWGWQRPGASRVWKLLATSTAMLCGKRGKCPLLPQRNYQVNPILSSAPVCQVYPPLCSEVMLKLFYYYYVTRYFSSWYRTLCYICDFVQLSVRVENEKWIFSKHVLLCHLRPNKILLWEEFSVSFSLSLMFYYYV